ncbi:hypothetical protein AB0H94_35180 [Streptomyces purpurascens]|uniref:hypothetical protein n=1 Tax=Streptomyces purpurascens TaxID=1924 RepID=UPI0033E83F01
MSTLGARDRCAGAPPCASVCPLPTPWPEPAGLQHGRLVQVAVQSADLGDANQVAQQITLDDAREDQLVAEAAVDRVRNKFAPRVIGPATVFRRAS